MHQAIGNERLESSSKIFAAIGVIFLGALLSTMMLGGCHNPNKNLKGAKEGMQAAPVAEANTEVNDDAIDPAVLREIVTETGSTIQAGDEIDVAVLQDEKLNGSYRIDNDGGFQWHYIGRVKTDSLTTNDLRRKLTDVVSEFLNNPSVTVNYKSQQPRTIRVLGEAKSQGHIQLKQNMRLIDGIAEAGGLTADAIRDATVAELTRAPGISDTLAREVYAFFNSELALDDSPSEG